MPDFLNAWLFYLSVSPDLTLLMGVCLYWIPLVMCAVFCFLDAVRLYQHDMRSREVESIYIPTLTVGHIVSDVLIMIIPVANLWVALFKVFPRCFSGLFRFLERVLDQPLVPKKRKP